MLGLALRNAIAELNIDLKKPQETIRATVIGTGIHTLNLSGSTIMTSPGVPLPLRNVPVVKPVVEDVIDKPETMAERLATYLLPYQLEGFEEPVAIALKLGEVNFVQIQRVALAIATATKQYINSGYPLIIIVEDDCGKVLGQTLRCVLNGNKRILCLDQLNVGDGDYIDIGKPIMDDTVVPVVIKTLVFNV